MHMSEQRGKRKARCYWTPSRRQESQVTDRDSVRGLVCVMRQTEAEGLVRRENKNTGICEGSPHLSIRPKVVFSGRSWDLVPWSPHTYLAQDSGVLEKEMRKELEDSRTLAIAWYCCWTAVLQTWHGIDISRSERL